MGFTQKLGLLAQGVYSDSSLNVGIGGAPSGSYKFETTGTAKISSTLLVSGVVTFGSTLSNGTYTYTLPSATGTLALTSDIHSAVTLSAIGSTANANGATLTGQVLNLQPANASFGGVVTTGSQTLAGEKTFTANILLSTTTSSLIGVIQKGSNRFIHNFELTGTTGLNTFVGVNSGNFTMTGSTGDEGSRNVGIGYNALQSNTKGELNTGVGFTSLSSNTTGLANSAIGTNSLSLNTTGVGNTAIGAYSLGVLTTGSYNIAIGYSSGGLIETGSGNTIIGNSVAGSSALTNNIILANGVGIKAQYDGTNWTFTGGTTITGVLTLNSTLSNGTYTYTLPSATGTLALTSALSGYLPLTGGTLTGALSGTSATFSSTITSGDNFLINNTAATKKGYTFQSPASSWGPQISGLYFSPNNAIDAKTTFTIDLWNGVGSTITPLTITDTGAATFSSTIAASGRISTSHSTSGDYAAVFYNSSTTGEGVTVRGGSTASHNAFIVQPYNGATTLFNILATGAATFSSTGCFGGGTNGGATFAINNGGAEAKQTFAGFSSNLNLTQCYNNSGAVYVVDEYRAASYSFKIGTTAALTIASTGNIGIGTTAPGAKLDVYGSTSNGTLASSIRISGYNGEYNNSPFASLDFYNVNNTVGSAVTARILAETSSPNATGGQLTFSTTTGGNPAGSLTERMRITSGGKVGIGQNSPNYSLTVNGSIQAGYILLGNTVNGNDSTIEFITVPNSTSYFGGAGNINYYGTGNLSLCYGGGKVLIGTITDNGAKFQVTGAGTFSSSIAATSATFTGDVAIGNYSQARHLDLFITAPLDGKIYWGQTASPRQMWIGGDGTPRLTAQVGGSGGVQLTSGATSWSSLSDERLKNINSNINSALDNLMTLQAVNFSWKYDDTNKENLGLIAQDIEKVFPQVIDKSKLPLKDDQKNIDETEYLSVRYTELIPVLVKAIQELSEKIKILENK